MEIIGAALVLDIGAIAAWAGAIGAIVACATLFIRPIKKLQAMAKADNEAIKNGMKIMLRYRLTRECEKAIRRNGMTLRDQANITEMFHAYQILGGNGAAKELYERTMELDIIPFIEHKLPKADI